ncbi:MAG: (Fe-S)-binding protein [Chloroflexi bacterium]|nr:(Fe-S)-binding protein [Chloroflexota bacterium]
MSPVSATYWGVPGYAIFWVLFAVAFGFFSRRIYFLFRSTRLGKQENRSDRIGRRTKTMLAEVLTQWCNLKSVSRKDLAGIGHALLFWGFSLFLISYVIFIGLAGGFGLSPVIGGTAFEVAYFSILDIAAVLVSLSLVWAAIRRYVVRPQRLELSAEAAIILSIVFTLMALNVSIEGFGYAASKVHASWPPLGAALAGFLSGLSQGTLEATFRGLWWLHYIVILGFTVYIPYSKHLHILTSPLNVFFKSLKPKGALKPIDLEQAESFGVSKVQDYTWKDLLDLYSCTVCGRCHADCPAQLSGKALSPREVILNLKEHLLEVSPGLLAGKAEADSEGHDKAMLGDVVTEEEIWDCTTCRACQEICPVSIEQMAKLIDMRRNLVMERASIPETGEGALKSLETRGHPWRGTTLSRTDWADGLGIKTLAEDSNTNVLLWVGCTEALEERSTKVAQAIAKILKLTGVSFGILGTEESCCGDPARRLGNEYLFQTQAQANIELLKNYGVKRIITGCPHCYNTLKNEYPQFGGEFEVIHHTQFIAGQLQEGKLKLAGGPSQKVTYHDACYLGRYNDIFTPPRQILHSLPGIDLVEMERNRKRSFCCGGGGGHLWLEEQRKGQRINEMRTEQAMAVGAGVIATACPYCLQMFEDGIKAKAAEGSLKVMDIAELIEGAASA